jgi:hypothetical protein
VTPASFEAGRHLIERLKKSNRSPEYESAGRVNATWSFPAKHPLLRRRPQCRIPWPDRQEPRTVAEAPGDRLPQTFAPGETTYTDLS